MEAKVAIAALAALAQETRLGVFRALVQAGPAGLSVGEIAGKVKAAPATLSFHLKELVHAGLITGRQESRFIFYAADYAAMSGLLSYLTENCCARDQSTCAVTDCAPQAPVRRARKTPAAKPAARRRSPSK